MLCLFAAGLAPPGMMPGRNAAGTFSVVLCTPDGLRTVLVPAETDENVPDGQSNSTDTAMDAAACPFSSLLRVALLPVAGIGIERRPAASKVLALAHPRLGTAPAATPVGVRAPPPAI